MDAESTGPQPGAMTTGRQIDVIVSDDCMQAHLRVQMTPAEIPHALLYEDIIALLDEKRVVFGIFGDEIKKTIANYNAAMHDLHRESEEQLLPIARGTPVTPGKAGRVELLVEPPDRVSFDDHGRADFRNVNRYRTVDKGQVLAKRIPAVPGKAGIDIFGREVPAPPPPEAALDDGPNVSFVPKADADGHLGGGEYIAREHGIFVHEAGDERDRIDVNPVLMVPGNVGLESGNVSYDGTVQIGGNIERAAMVSAIGDVEVGGAIESGDVRTGGSLMVRKGINTRRESMLNIGGDLQAVYVDNSKLTVGGHVIVQKSIIASEIICYGEVSVTASHSALSGGEIYAFGSVSADQIGNRTGVLTKIYLGDHPKNKQYYQLSVKELEQVEKDLEKLKTKVVKIKDYVQRMRGKIPVAKQAEFRVIYKAYKDQAELRERVSRQVAEFRETRYNHDPVRLIARDTLFAGVEIHYRDHIEKVSATQTKVAMRFAPGLARPELEAWKK